MSFASLILSKANWLHRWPCQLVNQQQRVRVSRGLAVLTLLADFNDLWGPVQVVYTSEDENVAIEINTFGGSIRALGEEADSLMALEGEIYCHWTA